MVEGRASSFKTRGVERLDAGQQPFQGAGGDRKRFKGTRALIIEHALRLPAYCIRKTNTGISKSVILAFHPFSAHPTPRREDEMASTDIPPKIKIVSHPSITAISLSGQAYPDSSFPISSLPDILPCPNPFYSPPCTLLLCVNGRGLWQLPGAAPDLSAATFQIYDESHTMGNSLRWMLMKNPMVEFCGYSRVSLLCVFTFVTNPSSFRRNPHPSENVINLRIQMFDALSALDALLKALGDLDDLVVSVQDKYNASLQAGKFERWEERR
ncbi:hypothetical protein NMY22_g11878 [Coprinellus aureogranulatus]|nr:hypothetical protein NMY22_g11878 [Coprinellus aureogranulatus]